MSNMLTDALMTDGVKWWPKVKVIKYSQSTIDEITKFIGHEPSGPELRWMEEHEGLKADDLAFAEGNSLVTSGLANLTKLVTGGAGTAFTATQGWAGIGDSSTATTIGMTTLQAATNRWYQIVDGAPDVTTNTNKIAANCTLTTGNGNYAWNEWVWGCSTGTITAGTAAPGTGPTLFNRAVASLGTKASGSWTLQATITFS